MFMVLKKQCIKIPKTYCFIKAFKEELLTEKQKTREANFSGFSNFIQD